MVHLVVPGRLRRFENLPDDALDDTILEMMREDVAACCTCGVFNGADSLDASVVLGR